MTNPTTNPPPPDPTPTHPHPRPQPNNTHNRVRQAARVHDPQLGPPPRPRYSAPRPTAAVRVFDCVQPVVGLVSAGAREKLRAALRSDELISGNAGSEARVGADVVRPVRQAIGTHAGYLADAARIFVGDGPVADIRISCVTANPEDARPTRLRSSWIVARRESSWECP